MFCLGLRQACQSKNYMQRQVSFREKSCAFVAWCLYVVSTYGGFGLSVSDVISGGLLGHLGPLCLALGANR